MPNVSFSSYKHAELDDLLEHDEHLLWSGQPGYGRRFFQIVGSERTCALGFLLGTIVMWGTIPFIGPDLPMARTKALWLYGAVTIAFVCTSIFMASQREFVLSHLSYFITNKRTIVCRRGRNWRFANRLYVISCSHMDGYPYEILQSKPFPSLQVGTMISQDMFQPFGLGLSHPGQPVLQNAISAPVVLEFIPEAEDLLALIQHNLA